MAPLIDRSPVFDTALGQLEDAPMMRIGVGLVVVLAACGDNVGAKTPDAGIDAIGAAHILFLNKNGGTYPVGPNDSVANTQQFSMTTATAPPFPYDDAAWKDVRDCVATLFAPYNVAVVDTDPGDVDHVEIVVTTMPAVFGLQNGIGGIAPSGCGDQPRGLATEFAGVFDASKTRQICEGVASMAGIVYGLDWALYCNDVMTYKAGCGDKAFLDYDAKCGEFMERPCRCTNAATQNSYQQLAATLGLR